MTDNTNTMAKRKGETDKQSSTTHYTVGYRLSKQHEPH